MDMLFGGRFFATRKGRHYRYLAVVGALASALVVLLAPVPFLVSSSTPDRLLTRLSNAGQAYGVAATVFSALALAAVAFSIAYQHRQTHQNQIITWQEMHDRMLFRAIDDPATIAPCIINTKMFEHDDQVRQYLYTTAWFHYCRSGLELGTLTESAVRCEILPEMFASDAARKVWRIRKEVTLAQYGMLDEFYAAVDEAYEMSVRNLDNDQSVAIATGRVPDGRPPDDAD